MPDLSGKLEHPAASMPEIRGFWVISGIAAASKKD